MKTEDGFSRIIKEIHDETRRQREEFNQTNRPTIELKRDDDVIGIWLLEDGSVSYAYRLPNGQYDPYKLINISKEIIVTIMENYSV